MLGSTAIARARHAERVPLAAPLIGAAIVLAGVATLVPWVTLFGGQAQVRGYQLDGGYLAGLVVIGAALLVTSAAWGGRLLRPFACLLGAAALADAMFSGLRIAGYVADPGPAGPLTLPVRGVGPWVMALGGLALVAAAVVTPTRPRRLDRDQILRLGLALSLFAAGWIHLLLAPAHLGEAAALGLGFVVAAVAQLVLAALAGRADRVTLLAAIVIDVAIVVLYGYAVLIGLPLEGHEHAVGLVLGAGEPVDALGAACLAAEATAVGLAASLLGRG